MACVELVSKLKTEGATLAPRATHPPGNEASVHPAGAFPMSGGQWISYHPHHPRWIRNRHVQPRGRPPHIHETEDEFFYVVKGEFKVKLGDHIMSAPAGSVMFVPRNTVFVIPIDLPNNASVKFSHLILLDTKFPRQIFNFAKCIFPFSNCDAVFTSRFFRKYHELPH